MAADIYVEVCQIFHTYYFIYIKEERSPGWSQDRNSKSSDKKYPQIIAVTVIKIWHKASHWTFTIALMRWVLLPQETETQTAYSAQGHRQLANGRAEIQIQAGSP